MDLSEAAVSAPQSPRGPELRFNNGKLCIELVPQVSPEQMVENMRSALARGLPELRWCKPHEFTLAIASGGPSLEDTYKELNGDIAAVNGSLGFLLERDIVPVFCGVLDANEHMTDIVAADPRVRYLVASNCHPSLFDKLLGAGCKVWLWHTTPASVGSLEAETVLKEARPETWQMIGGGCSIGLRLINIGYVLGYRDFHLHGLDSSFRDRRTHAYADRRFGDWVDQNRIMINGYPTSINYMQQVTDFAGLLNRFAEPDIDPCEFQVFGDGLLQSCWRKYKDAKGAMSAAEAFQQW